RALAGIAHLHVARPLTKPCVVAVRRRPPTVAAQVTVPLFSAAPVSLRAPTSWAVKVRPAAGRAGEVANDRTRSFSGASFTWKFQKPWPGSGAVSAFALLLSMSPLVGSTTRPEIARTPKLNCFVFPKSAAEILIVSVPDAYEKMSDDWGTAVPE